MSDKVTICNVALAHIGENAAVISPDEESEEAQACATFYPTAKAKLLECYDWSFASKRHNCVKIVSETFGYRNAFSLPSDCLRIQFLRDIHRAHAPFPTDWNYEVVMTDSGRVLLTDCPHPQISYISSDVSEAYFSPAFADALSWLLATYLAGERIKGKEGASFAQNCQQQYAMALSQAKTLDARNQRGRTGFLPDWIWRR